MSAPSPSWVGVAGRTTKVQSGVAPRHGARPVAHWDGSFERGGGHGQYLIVASYTSQGIKGVIDKGGTARRDAVEKMAADLGGHVESFHFGFGEGDAYVIVELPDNIGAAAVGLVVGASGMATTKTIVLLTPEEIDRAAATSVNYAPPGS